MLLGVPEKELYEHVAHYIEIRFSEGIRPRHGPLFRRVEITALKGDMGSGKWTRPDLCMLSLWRYKYGTHLNLDVYGFEVKKSGKIGVDAVHETLAHTRLVNYAYLTVPCASDDEDWLPPVLESCNLHGVGLITFLDVRNVNSFRIITSAKRFDPSPNALDNFIKTRFSDPVRSELLKCIRTPSLFDL
jgi:hypothetical protein